jgi:uncharacterized iron-regulated protein
MALAATLAACAPTAPERPVSYTYPVPPGVTYDLARGEAVDPAQVPARLHGVRLLFLGEQHSEPRSHAFQHAVLEQLAASGRPLRVALEMFPPQADPALEDWRQGRLDELTFLERADWYGHWGFPWSQYRDLFLLFRDRRIPLHGVNASRAEREAVRAGRPEALAPDVRALLGDLDETVAPHEAYLRDALRGSGHGVHVAESPEAFRRYYRVQRLWDRLMGVRVARLAESPPDDGLTVLLIGSGHLAYGLGANLHAARATGLPRLSVWDTRAPPEALDARGRYPVPVGMADWVRVYVHGPPEADLARRGVPTLGDVRLEAAPDGVRIAAVRPGPGPGSGLGSDLSPVQAGDLVLALNGEAPRSPTALRWAFERLPPGQPARLAVQRGDRRHDLTLEPAPQSP